MHGTELKQHCSEYTSHSLYQDVYANAPEHFHLIPSLLSSQTSYPLIGMCRSLPSNHLANWEFSSAIRRKLRLPLFPPPPPNLTALAALPSTPLAITSLNAPAYAKLVHTILFVMASPALSPPHLLPQASSLWAYPSTLSHNFAFRPTPTPGHLIFLSTPTLQSRRMSTTVVLTPPSVPMLRLVPPPPFPPSTTPLQMLSR